MTTTPNRSPRPSLRRRRDPVSLALVVITLTAPLVGCPATQPSSRVDRDVQKSTAPGVVTIDFIMSSAESPTAEIETVNVADVVAGTTLQNVLARVKSPKLRVRGDGPTAFVESIGGLQPSPGEGWLFSVDGEFAMQGIGTLELSPPCKVRWWRGWV